MELAKVAAMPDALDLLKTRKSISAQFLSEPGPNEAQLGEILTVATRVPDHGKLTPWRFILFRGDARQKAGEALARLFASRNPGAEQKQIEEERVRFSRAPLVVAVVSTAAAHPKIPEFEQLLSAGNAAFNLELAAHALGFAAQWTTGWPAYDADAGKILGLKEGERFVGFIHIGTSTVPFTDRPRPSIADVVSDWKAPE
jgi:nitroreductase